jgi:hypothetical protein
MKWSSENHSGAEDSEPAPAPMDAEQERAFEHDMHASRHLGLTEEQKAAKAYAKAMGIYR